MSSVDSLVRALAYVGVGYFVHVVKCFGCIPMLETVIAPKTFPVFFALIINIL